MHASFHIQTCGELLFGQSRVRRERRQTRMFVHVTRAPRMSLILKALLVLARPDFSNSPPTATSNLAQTPQRLIVIRVTRYTTHPYVIHFKGAPNFGGAKHSKMRRCKACGVQFPCPTALALSFVAREM
jgi:hypothetical protein